jgi:hypothetical protein
MPELKTQPLADDPRAFLGQTEPESRRTEALHLLDIFTEATGERAVLWGSGMVGFGRYDYQYASGQKGTWFRVGFAVRKGNLSLYLMPEDWEKYEPLLAKLGKHKVGKGCLYLNKLSDANPEALRQLVVASFQR